MGAGGAIPLGGGAIPLGGSMGAGGAIPLGGSIGPGGAIPLDGSMGAGGAIPLDGSMGAGDAIPLDGSMGAGDAIPLDGSMDAGDAIPLDGSSDEEASARPSAAPSLTHESAPESLAADQLPPLGGDLLAGDADEGTQLTAHSTPSFMDSLPLAADPAADAYPDLPVASPEPEGSPPLPEDLPAALALADDVEVLDELVPLDGDEVDATGSAAPASAGSGVQRNDDLPVPSGEDEHGAETVAGDDPMALEGLPFVETSEAPRLMDELLTEPPASPDAHPLTPQAPEPAATAGGADGPNVAALDAPPAAGARSRRGTGVRIAAVGVAVLLLLAGAGLVAFGTPWLEMQLFDPLALVLDEPTSDAGARSQPALARQDETAPKPDEAAGADAAAEGPAPSAAVEKPAPELTEANVDTLGYAELSRAAVALAAKGEAASGDLLAWARYRLATSFADEAAAEQLAAETSRPAAILKMNGLGAAAAIGATALAGKSMPARQLGERLLRTRLKDSPQLALVVARTYTRRPELPKAVRRLDRALQLAPFMVDLSIDRGTIMLAGPEASEGAVQLAQVASAASDPDLALRAAGALIDAARFEELDGALTALTSPAQLEQVAPPRRDLFLRLLARKHVRAGNLEAALEAARVRAEKRPDDLGAVLELARLEGAAGADGGAVLAQAAARFQGVDAAHIVAERTRFALARHDVEAAKAALQAGADLPAKPAEGWLKLAAGWIAQAEGRESAARVALNAAARGRPRFAEARLELALLEADKPGVLMKRLTELDKKLELPDAAYHLARLMRSRGNAKGAAQLLDRVLWIDPVVADPVEMVLEWTDLLDLSGEAERARALVEGVRAARPGDERALAQLIALAQRNQRHDEALAGCRSLIAAHPDDPELKVRLAGALVDAGKAPEAQSMLDELVRANPKARTSSLLFVLARAWKERDAFRARDRVKESIAIEPTVASYMLLGELEEDEDARIAYEKALALDPRLVEPRLRIARIDIKAGRYGEAAKILEKAFARSPDNVEAAVLLGDALAEQGKVRDAVARYETALATGGDRVPLLMKVAMLQLQSEGQLAPAVKMLRRAVKAEPKAAEPRYHLGMALKDQGLIVQALEQLRTYVELAPDGEWVSEAQRAIEDMEQL